MSGDARRTGASALIVESNKDRLYHACDVKFTREVRNATITSFTFRLYLDAERRFVLQAVRLLASTILNSPDETALAKHTYAAYDLIDYQRRYFTEANREIASSKPGLSANSALEQGLTNLARSVIESGDYWKLIVVGYATEYMYITWCKQAWPHIDPTTPVGRWVEIHTSRQFENRVKFLAAEVNRAVDHNNICGAVHLFGSAVDAEARFHEAIYFPEKSN